MNWKIFNEDAIKWANEYDGEPFHALLSDPPYHLTSIVKRFGKENSSPAKFGSDGVFSRSSNGFMGQKWDGGDIAFQPETWYAFSKVMYPGAFGMAFSASRNWHRLAVAIEDAGFVIHPSIFCWLQGQGFPKSTNIEKQIQDYPDLPEIWKGHKYGLQALKPAVEPIIVFQKPYEGRPIDNIISTGAGALNIDGGRIETKGEGVVINRFTDGAKPWGNGSGHEYETEVTVQGRYPANFILDEGLSERLDNQSGELKAGTASNNSGAMGYHGGRRGSTDEIGYGDNGGASRFFFRVSDQIDEADLVYYTSKVGKKERNAGLQSFPEKERSYMNTHNGNPDGNPHPTLKPISLSKYLATLLLPPKQYSPRRLFVPFSGVASEMIGACLSGWEEVVGVEFDKENGYVDIANKRLEHWCKDK